jgi:hypothetical protein
MPNLFITVKDIQVHSANASTSYLTNAYPVAATIGFIDAFRFFLKQNNKDVYDEFDEDEKSESFSIIKSFNILEGKKAFPAFHKEGSSTHKSITPSEVQLNETQCNFQSTMIFKLPLVEEGIGDEAEILQLFKGFLNKARLAGGKIINLDQLEVQICESSETLSEILSQEKGWCVMDASQPFADVVEEKGIQEAVREFTFTFIEKKTIGKDTVTSYVKKQKGWFFLNLKGYRFLEQIQYDRAGIRAGKPHVFVEPVVTANTLNYFKSDHIYDFFWKWNDHEKGVELVQS